MLVKAVKTQHCCPKDGNEGRLWKSIKRPLGDETRTGIELKEALQGKRVSRAVIDAVEILASSLD